ncbi:MAG: PorV/PorQ family protein [Chloroherpetonaceae bacterium]|nr:PorV/PorQ family protein [Chloroherpetonaceae bacterium]
MTRQNELQLSAFRIHSLRCFLLLFTSFFPNLLLAQSGGLSFLGLGNGAQEEARGNTGTASSIGAAANYYNPARLNSGENSEVLFTHNLWIFDTQSSFVAISAKGEESAFGASFQWFTVGDIPVRTIASENPVGFFTAQSAALSVSYARDMAEGFSIALTGKVLYEKLFVDDAMGAAFDISASYAVTPLFQLGASLQNIGWMSPLAGESSQMPTQIRLGASYRIPLASLKSSILFEANSITNLSLLLTDNVTPNSGSLNRTPNQVMLGSEFNYDNIFSVRAGYQFIQTARTLSFGVGIGLKPFQIDYAVIPFSESLGTANMLSVRFLY